MTAAILCSDLSFSWPDGAPVLSGLTVSFGPGRTGLIGVNGSGKSTLLRLIAGELRPGSGAVRARGEVGYLPQAITLGTRRSVSDLIGVTAARDALHAIEAGETGEAAFAAVGDDWDVKQARRDRQGRRVAASGSLPRIVASARKRAAQETAGRSRELHAERLQAARDRLAGTLSGGERWSVTCHSGSISSTTR